MKRIIKIILALVLVVSGQVIHAQQEVEMADTLRSEGKIYVVVVIILIIFTGILTYLFLMDRKVTRLEKRLPGKKP